MADAVPSGFKQGNHGLIIPEQLQAIDEGGDVSTLHTPSEWLTHVLRGARTLAGTDVSPQTAMTIAAYFACLRNISEDVGKLPLITYKHLTPRGKEKAMKHPLYKLLLLKPNTNHSAMTFKETMTQFVMGWGNAYAEIVFDPYTGYAKELWPIHPSRVRVTNLKNEGLVYDVRTNYSQWMGGVGPFEAVRLQANQVLHLRGLGAEGMYGYSIAQLAAESLGLTLAAENFGAAFFGNGTWLGGVLEHPGVLGAEALQHIRDSFEERYRGPANAHRPAILEEGMKYKPLGIPPEDAQFLLTREFQVAEIARWFRMPLHKIQHITHSATGGSAGLVEQQNIEYVTDTLMPWFVRWEQELQLKLFANDDTHFAEFVVNALMRGDSRARAEYYKAMFAMAAMSPNDIRAEENMNPIGKDGDEYFLPANNLAPIGLVVKGQTQMPNQPVGIPPQNQGPTPPEQPPGSERRNGTRRGADISYQEKASV